MKAPPAVQAWHPPAWATVHNAELAAGAFVVILLAFAVLRLSKGSKAAPVPAPAPKKSGGAGRLLLLAAAGIGGFVLYERHVNAAARAKAAPRPSPAPSPSPHPTVTQTVAPHVTSYHFPLTGTQVIIALAVIVIGGFLITRVVVRNTP